tara:strand:+ start:1149 stop:2546 length:1398 start_codon:yes stop_codon:yes gene_type:complete
MTISTTSITKSGLGNGTAHSFVYDFPIFADADLTVIVRSAAGTETTKTLNTHYVVTGAGSPSGGTVLFKFNTGNSSDAHYSLTDQRPASGETVVIRSELSNTQTLDLVANDPFPASSFETALDRLVRMVQQHDEELDRSIKLSRTNTMTSTEFTNSATDRASKILAFDSTGELSVTSELGTFRGNWAASTTYALRDIVKDTSTNNIFIATTAHTSSGAQPLTTNTDSAKWSLLVDAATATTAQSAAAASASTASGHASTATTKASEASTSATKSENYAVKVDGAVPSTGDHSSKAWAVGGTGVTDTAGAGPAKDWAIETTGKVDGTEYSAKEYSIGTGDNSGMNTGSAKQWSIGGGTGFDRDTAVTGSGGTAEYSAKYWANQAKNETQTQRDVYYGAFTNDAAAEAYQTGAAPTGNAGTVDAGDLYFDSSNNTLRVYDGTNWNDAAADTTSFATNGFSIAMAIAL